jgi:hypothetical protein
MLISRLQVRALARYNSMSVPHDMEGAIAVFWNEFLQMKVALTVPFERDMQHDSCAADSCQMLDNLPFRRDTCQNSHVFCA